MDQEDAPHLGQQVGSYRLLRVLGRGGMGIVYLGEHVYLGKKTAIKILRGNITKVFSGSVILKEFNRVNRYFVLSQTYGRPGVKDHGAYPICATICKKFVMDWKREKRP